MRKILLASHGLLADGMKNTIEMMLGKQKNLFTLCAYTSEDDHTKEDVLEIVSNLLESDELIVVTDIFGGSVNNEFMKYLRSHKFYLVSGMNLPLIAELLFLEDSGAIEEMLALKMKDLSKYMKYCNEIIANEKESNDEDF